MCTSDYEILSVSFRPFYLPREIGQITIVLSYVPGLDYETTGNKIAERFSVALACSPEQPVLILGEVNSCDLSTFLPAVHQYVDCPTKLLCILDKCYGNIVNGYKAICCPPLGKSDHNVVHLFPRYRAKIKQEKPIVKTSTSVD